MDPSDVELNFASESHVQTTSSDFGTTGPKAKDNKKTILQNQKFRNRSLAILAAILAAAIVVVIAIPRKSSEEPESPLEACIVPYPIFDTLLFAVDNSNYTVEQGCRKDRTIDVLWVNNIYGGVLVEPSTVEGFDREYMLEQLKLFPSRLRGVISFDPLANTPSEAGLDATFLDKLDSAGVRGIRWNVRNYNQNQRNTLFSRLNTRPFQDLFDFMRARRWHLDVQQHARHWPTLLQNLQQIDVRIVIDNFGPPATVDDSGLNAVLDAVKSSGRTWLRFSGAGGLNLGEENMKRLVERVLDTVPLQSILWGSAYSDPEIDGFHFNYEDDLLDFETWIPRFSQRLQVLQENPKAVYGFAV